MEMTDPDLSDQGTQIKLDPIKNDEAEMVITGCQQCVRTMTTRARRQKTNLKVKDLKVDDRRDKEPTLKSKKKSVTSGPQ